MKKYTACLLVFVYVAVMFICGSSYAVDYVPYIALQLDNPNISINGYVVPIDDKNTAPVLRDGSAMLPLAVLVNAINQLSEWNLSVLWDDSERKVTLMADRPIAQLWIDKTTAVIDGAEIEVRAAPMIINDRAMVPVRVITDSLGLYLKWYGDTRAILISFSPSGFPAQIVFPFDDTQQAAPAEVSYTNGFRPVLSREEVYGIWELNDYEARYNLRFEERYLISLYNEDIANERIYAPSYNLENGRLWYSSVRMQGIGDRSFLKYEDFLFETTPENIQYNVNDLWNSEVEWSIEISEDGNSLRISREVELPEIIRNGEYRVVTRTYERLIDP